jgi:hypothetical protein
VFAVSDLAAMPAYTQTNTQSVALCAPPGAGHDVPISGEDFA